MISRILTMISSDFGHSEVVMKFTQIADGNSDRGTHLLAMLSCDRSHNARPQFFRRVKHHGKEQHGLGKYLVVHI